MARIDMSCTRCGARVVTASVAEVIAWNDGHASVCLGPAPVEVED